MKEKSYSLPELSTRATELPPSGIRRFFDIAAQMPDVVSLGVGEPDFVTPWTIREAAVYSIEKGQTSYTSNFGLLELRREISKYLRTHYDVPYNPDNEVLVTFGVSEGLDLALRAVLNPGDKVLVPEPCYVSYKPCVLLSGGIPLVVPTSADKQFQVQVEDLENALEAGTKAILLGYPSNPTGAVMPFEAMQAVVDFAVKHNLYLISDEIYDRLTFEGTHTCVPSLPGAWERTILLNGFSKSYAMTGWRVGYACAPAAILQIMMKIHSYTALCASITSQKAALEALRQGESALSEMVVQYRRRRNLIVGAFNRLGLSCHMPKATFYAFPDITRTGLSAEEFTERLLFEAHVAVVPGTAFGESGKGHIRCSYATGLPKIEEALRRIEAFVTRIKPDIIESKDSEPVSTNHV